MLLFFKKIRFASIIAGFICSIIILSFTFHDLLNLYDKRMLALKPGDWKQFYGVITIIFAHGDLKHLVFNIIPLFVLIFLLVFFYLRISLQVIGFVVLMGGIGVFLFASGGYHIGASGLVFGLITFLISSGFIRQNRSLLVVSLLVVMFYGGTLWGVFPLSPGVSWEGHLYGAIAGFLAAIIWRKQGPQKDLYQFSYTKDKDDDEYMIFSTK